MSEINCESCSNLRENAPGFVVNGVTDDVADSLANNTGLNPNLGVLRDNCEDLNDVNDCLIGMLPKEIEGYDVCDWKEFTKMFLGNMYETLKAMIASDCGQWGKIESMCSLIGATIAPPAQRYGVMPLNSGPQVGTAVSSKVKFHEDDGTLNPATKHLQMIGIRYAKIQQTGCATGDCEEYEWIMPQTYLTYIKSGTAVNDVLWYVDKATIQAACGFSNSLWQNFTDSAYTWTDSLITNGASAGKMAHLELTVNPGNMGNNYLGIVYKGTSYPNEATTTYDIYLSPINTALIRLYTHSC